MKLFLIIVLTLYSLGFMVMSFRTGRFCRGIAPIVLSGAGTLVILHTVGSVFALYVPLNIYTLLFCGLTGISGNIFVLLAGFVFT